MKVGEKTNLSDLPLFVWCILTLALKRIENLNFECVLYVVFFKWRRAKYLLKYSVRLEAMKTIWKSNSSTKPICLWLVLVEHPESEEEIDSDDLASSSGDGSEDLESEEDEYLEHGEVVLAWSDEITRRDDIDFRGLVGLAANVNIRSLTPSKRFFDVLHCSGMGVASFSD